MLGLAIFLHLPILISNGYGIRDLPGGTNEVFNDVSPNSFPHFKYHHSVCLGFLYLLSKGETFWVSVCITQFPTLNTTQTHLSLCLGFLCPICKAETFWISLSFTQRRQDSSSKRLHCSTKCDLNPLQLKASCSEHFIFSLHTLLISRQGIYPMTSANTPVPKIHSVKHTVSICTKKILYLYGRLKEAQGTIKKFTIIHYWYKPQYYWSNILCCK